LEDKEDIMKRFTMLLIVIVMALYSATMASGVTNRVLYSAVKTADALIATGWTEMHGIIVSTDGTNAVTMDIYNGTSSAGAKIAPTITFPATPVTQAVSFNPPVSCSSGIYINITTAGTLSYTVYYYRAS
jgi:hypothetical protein